MMMVEARLHQNWHRDIFICVPDQAMLSAFIGYKVIDESEVPRELDALVCDEADFEEFRNTR